MYSLERRFLLVRASNSLTVGPSFSTIGVSYQRSPETPIGVIISLRLGQLDRKSPQRA